MRKKGMIAEKYIMRKKYVWKQKNKTQYIKFRLVGVVLYKLVTVMNYRISCKYFINLKYVKYMTGNMNFQVES